MERGGVNRVALSGGRFGVGENIAEMGVAAFGGDSGALHIVGSIQFLNQQIFRDWLGKGGLADAGIVFVERTKQGFAGDDIDVNAGPLVVPKLILERRLGAALPHHEIFLGL